MDYKKMFPMFKNNRNIVYFDNSALTFKPKLVIKSINDFYTKYSVSTRTSDSTLGIKISNLISQTKNNIGFLIDAKENEIIFTSGTTESLNLIIRMLSKIIFDGEILLSYYNHSSNIVPFIEIFKNSNIKINYFSDMNSLLKLINNKTKIISLSQITNNFNVAYDLETIYKLCKEKNIILINDAAQVIAHQKISLHNSDVIVFSGNKLYGPTGVGVLCVKEDLLRKLEPQKWGGGQVQNIDYNVWTAKNSLYKYEPGTLNFAGILGLNAAVNFIKLISYKKINQIENKLANYLYDELSKLDNIVIESKRGDLILLFNVKNIPSQDVTSYLGHKNIYVRSGIFCAHMITKNNNIKYKNSYIRISISFYNTKRDVDILVKTLKKGGDFLEFLYK